MVNADCFYTPASKPWSANMRLTCFETGGYNSRIYTYENDVLYGYSIPPFYNKGCRYYVNFRFNAARRIRKPVNTGWRGDIWLRWAQTVYQDKSSIGSGLDKIAGSQKSELKFQIMVKW
jgi:hypothetical protein